VEKFFPNGTYDLQWGSFGSGNGLFNNPQGITVDPVTGNVWVLDSGNDRVQQFTSNGAFICAYGLPNNPSGGNGHFNTPYGIASDASGNLYIADTGNGLIQVLAPCGGIPTSTFTNTPTNTATSFPSYKPTPTETLTPTPSI